MLQKPSVGLQKVGPPHQAGSPADELTKTRDELTKGAVNMGQVDQWGTHTKHSVEVTHLDFGFAIWF